MQHSSGNFPGCRHDEGVLPWRRGLHGAKDHVVEVDEPAQLSEICADQREVMPVVQLTDLSNPLQTRPVVKLAAEREAGIRRVGDQPVSSQHIGHSANRSRLRVVRMDVEVSGHEIERSGRQPNPLPGVPIVSPWITDALPGWLGQLKVNVKFR
jgi:hypothetical protein